MLWSLRRVEIATSSRDEAPTCAVSRESGNRAIVREVGSGIQARKGACDLDGVWTIEAKMITIGCAGPRLVQKLHSGSAGIPRRCCNGHFIIAWPVCAPAASLVAWALVGVCRSTSVRCTLPRCRRLTGADNIGLVLLRSKHVDIAPGNSVRTAKDPTSTA